MRRFGLLTLCFASTAVAAPPAAQQFLDDAYRHFRQPGYTDSAYLCPSLRSLIDKDNALAKAKGEVPYVNGDLLCDCQDGELTGLSIAAGNGKWADVSFRIDNRPRQQRMLLRPRGGSWCIDNIVGSDGDLRKRLREDIVLRKAR